MSKKFRDGFCHQARRSFRSRGSPWPNDRGKASVGSQEGGFSREQAGQAMTVEFGDIAVSGRTRSLRPIHPHGFPQKPTVQSSMKNSRTFGGSLRIDDPLRPSRTSGYSAERNSPPGSTIPLVTSMVLQVHHPGGSRSRPAEPCRECAIENIPRIPEGILSEQIIRGIGNIRAGDRPGSHRMKSQSSRTALPQRYRRPCVNHAPLSTLKPWGLMT